MADLMPADRLSTVEEHVERIVTSIRPLPPYDQPLLEAIGLSVCEPITASIDLPSFDNSAMDGYAVYFDDVATASEDRPVHLPVVGEMAAGQTRLFALSPGTTVRIMTGAPVPHGADAVVPIEWTDGGVAHVRITRAPERGQHVRAQGEDVRVGDVLLEEGRVLGPRQLGLVASVGRAQVRARPRPRVVIISTGAELREPGTSLGHDSIYDGNSFMLAAAARDAGAIAYRVGIVSDDPNQFQDALSDQLVRADLVVTSGGVSKGAHDVVKEVLTGVGTVSFGEVAMQPGMPQGFGTLGPDDTPLFTLPGNPVSAYVSFLLFVAPALAKLQDLPAERQRPLTAALTDPVRSPDGRRSYLRGVLDDARETVVPLTGQSSHQLGALAQANALIIVPEQITRLEAGAAVDVMCLP